MADLAAIGSSVLLVIVLILSGLVAVGLIGGSLWFYKNWKRYNEYICVVWERDGFGQLTESSDKAGIFVDPKTKNKRFFLKKGNVGLDPDNVPYLPSIGKGSPKTVYLLRTGLKNYHFITPKINDLNISLEVGEEDVNWSINAYDRQKKLFDQNKFMQFLPFIALAFVSIIILVIFIYFFREFSTLKDMALAFKEASKSLANAQTGTVVID